MDHIAGIKGAGNPSIQVFCIPLPQTQAAHYGKRPKKPRWMRESYQKYCVQVLSTSSWIRYVQTFSGVINCVPIRTSLVGETANPRSIFFLLHCEWWYPISYPGWSFSMFCVFYFNSFPPLFVSIPRAESILVDREDKSTISPFKGWPQTLKRPDIQSSPSTQLRSRSRWWISHPIHADRFPAMLACMY